MTRTTNTVAALMIGASCIALASPAMATDTLFATSQIDVREGARINQQKGVTQVRLNNGATASFVDAADFQINADGSIDLYAGGVTVTTGTDGSETMVRMPEGVEGRVAGTGAAASFSVGPDGEARGHALSGQVRIGRAGDLRLFDAGDMFAISRAGSVRQVVSNGAQSTPDIDNTSGDSASMNNPIVAMGEGAGPIAAAQNGLPVSLGDALAAAGASGDILSAARRVESAAANPSIETFPSGDLRLLVSAAADLEGAFGGTPFPAAQTDIIRTYLAFLAGGGSGADFLTAYSGFLVQYFDLIRVNGTPSTFALANVEDINAFTSFLARTRGFATLSAQDQALADAYFAFIAGGGDANLFSGTFTDLTEAYFAFLRAGGNPQDFADASLATVEDYIAFLDASGLEVQLSVNDRALLDAYLANGGFAFVGQYRAALDAYFAFLASGQRPSDYDGADVSVLLGYVQTLQAAGLLDAAVGDNAQFFADFAAFVQGGGQIDAFAQANANIFAGYADALTAYFAFLDAGGVPSGYTAADVDILNDYIAQLAAAGALDRFLGDQSAFFADYLAFLQGGGTLDTYTGLNANVFAGYADALAAYYTYLENGGLPSGYTVLDQDTIQAYLAALARVGATDGFLADLAAFYSDYFAFIADGGNPDNFAGLPVPPDFPALASALNAYAAFLSAGGLPSNYDAVDFNLLQNYLEAVVASGQLADLLGANADLLTSYFTYFATGGSLDGFSGLPIYGDYVTALNAYYAFIADGGTPSEYTVLTQAQIEAYLSALSNTAGGGFANFAALNDFFVQYFAYLDDGGDPDQFAGLPGADGPGGSVNPNTGLVYTGGFDHTDAQVDATGYGFGNFNAGSSLADASRRGDVSSYNLRDDGGVTAFSVSTTSGDIAYLSGSTQIVDVAGDAEVLIGRWTDGSATLGSRGVVYDFTANQGYHYVLFDPVATGFSITDGLLVNYVLGATTQPTINDGSLAPGVFDAQMTVRYGLNAFGNAGAKAGLVGTVTMPDSGDDLVWSFATPGGLTDETQWEEVSTSGNQFLISAPASDNKNACGSPNCQLQMRSHFVGENGTDKLASTYTINTGSIETQIRGAAIWVDANSSGSGGGGNTTFLAGDGNAPVGTAGDQVAFITSFASSTVGISSPIDVTDGALLEADLNLERISIQPTADSEFQKGGSDGVLGWSRISNFSGSQTNSNRQSFVLQPFASQFVHSIWGTPVVNLPTSGLINYDLVGWTTPTASNATDLTGSTFDGELAIDFASLTLGLEATVDVVTESYTLSSVGGVANPSIGIITNPSNGRGIYFSGGLNAVDSGGRQVSRGAVVNGFLAGDDASHVGLTYGIRVASSNTIQGSAAFRAAGIDTRGATGSAAQSTMAIANVPVPAPVPAIASAPDWSRWTVPSDALSTSMAAIAPGLGNETAIAPSAAGSRPNPREVLGDLITFPEVR